MTVDWTINPSVLLSAAAVVVSLWRVYKSNVQKAEEMHRQNIVRLEKIESRLDVVYGFYEEVLSAWIRLHAGQPPTKGEGG